MEQLEAFIEKVKTTVQPPARGDATAATLKQLAGLVPADVILADLEVGWNTVSRARITDEDPAVVQRRRTCAELAESALKLRVAANDVRPGSLYAALRTWKTWQLAFQGSNDPRHAAMGKTFAREFDELTQHL